MKKTTIVIIGGGFGGIYTAKRLLKLFKRDKFIEIVLINTTNYFIFTPMLHEVATGGLNRRSVIEPIREVIKSENFRFIKEQVKKIDLKRKEIKGKNICIPYDYLIMATGSKTQYFGTLGAEKYTLPLKTMVDASRIKNHVIECFEKVIRTPIQAEQALTIVIVGGGPTGVELAAEMVEFVEQTLARTYPNLSKYEPKVILINSGDELLKHAHPKVRKAAYGRLVKQGVDVFLNARVTKVTKDGITLNTHKKIKTDTVIWATGVTPNAVSMTPDILDKRGHVPVNKFLYNEEFSKVFALGDCALQIDPNTDAPVPNLAQVATGQAKVCADNIFRRITGAKPLDEYSFKSKGFLVSVGSHYAIAEIKGFHFSGFFAWWLWRTIYLMKLLSFKNKLRTAFDWTLDLFYDRDITETE